MIIRLSLVLRIAFIALGAVLLLVALSQRRSQLIPSSANSSASQDNVIFTTGREASKPAKPSKPGKPNKPDKSKNPISIIEEDDEEDAFPTQDGDPLKPQQKLAPQKPQQTSAPQKPPLKKPEPQKTEQKDEELAPETTEDSETTDPLLGTTTDTPEDADTDDDDDDEGEITEIDLPDAADDNDGDTEAEEITEIEGILTDDEDKENTATEVDNIPEPEPEEGPDDNEDEHSGETDEVDEDGDAKKVQMVVFPERKKREFTGKTGAVFTGYNVFTCKGQKDQKDYIATQLVEKNRCLCRPKDKAVAACNPKNFTLSYTPDFGKRTPYNIVLISIDTMRRDVLSFFYGWKPRRATRFLNKKFASAIKFKHHFGNAPWTLPSHSAMLTGLYPEQVGSLDSDHWIKVPKLPHYLGEQYVKYGVVQNLNLTPDDPISPADLAAAMNKTHVAAAYQFGWSAGWDSYSLRGTPIRACRDFLATAGSSERPFFLFCHTNVMHDYDSDYYSQSREMDNQMWNLMTAIDFDKTIVVFTSDHGEGLDRRRGWVGHGKRLHNDLTHLACGMWLPTSLIEKFKLQNVTTVNMPTSNMDIVPTILKLIGDDEAPENFPGDFMLGNTSPRTLYASNRNAVVINGNTYRLTKARNAGGHGGDFIKATEVELRTVLKYPMKYFLQGVDNWSKELVYNIYNDYDERTELQELDEGAMKRASPQRNSMEFVLFDAWASSAAFTVTPDQKKTIFTPQLIEGMNPEVSGYRLKAKNFGRKIASALAAAKSDWVVFVLSGVQFPHGWLRDVQEQIDGSDPQIFGGVGVAGDELLGHWNDKSGHHFTLKTEKKKDAPICDELQFGWFVVHKSLANKCTFVVQQSKGRFFVSTTETSSQCEMRVHNAFSIFDT